MTFTPTPEQTHVVDLAMTGEHMAIDALAGSAKTTSCMLVAEAKGPSVRGLYMTFNKVMKIEAESKFPRSVRCSTAHALAYRTVGCRYAHRLNGRRLKSYEIANRLNIDACRLKTPFGVKYLASGFLAGIVMKGVRCFSQSDDPEPTAAHIPTPDTMRDDRELMASWDDVRKMLEPSLRKAWADVCDPNGVCPYSPDDYLKLYSLDHPRIPVDYLLLDECFPSGTMVETHLGPVPIEKIAECPEEDWRVLSVLEDKTLRWSSVSMAYKTPRQGPLVKVSYAGTSLICTANHPLRVGNKWVPAGLLKEGDVLRLVRRAYERPSVQDTVLQRLVRDEMEPFPRPRERASSHKSASLLFHVLHRISRAAARILVLQPHLHDELRPSQSDVGTHQFEDQRQQVSSVVGAEKSGQPDVSRRNTAEGLGYPKSEGSCPKDTGWERERVNGTSTSPVGAIADIRRRWALVPRTCSPYWVRPESRRSTHPLQDRHSQPSEDVGCRSRRWFSPFTKSERSGRAEGFVLEDARVDGIEVFERVNCVEPQRHNEIDFVYTLSVQTGCYFADGVLVKNCQDLSMTMLSIANDQRSHAQLILVGDRFQSIYGWRGSINAMQVADVTHRGTLTHSFRFGPEIAEQANRVLDMLAAPVRVTGRGPSGRVGPVAFPDVVLSRTNAIAVRRALDEIENGGSPHIVGGASDVVSFARGALDLQEGRKSYHADLACFDNWSEVRAYVDSDELGGDLKLLVKLVDDFGADRIVGSLASMPVQEKATIVLSTAHGAKGREWSSVQLADDFPDDADPTRPIDPSEKRLCYVAVTRARKELDIESVGLLRQRAPRVA